jgi:putative ABC transport system permease protein
MDGVYRNLKFAVRKILRQPGFAVVIILISAVGIGANTAIFSVINKILLQSLPYKDADRLVFVQQVRAQQGKEVYDFSYPRFNYLQENYKSFDRLAAYVNEDSNLTTLREPIRVHGLRVSTDFFAVLGITPVLGRTFVSEEDRAGGNPVVIISYELWQNSLQGDANIVGNSIGIDGLQHTVAGILPPGLKYINENVDIWVPRVFESSLFRSDIIHIGAAYLDVVGHLRDGVSQAEAEAELKVVTRQYQQAYSGNVDSSNDSLLTPLRQRFVNDIRLALMVLFAAVGCVLLIACANIANLLLTSATTRYREMAVRTALGASRRDLIWQMLTESFLLAISGGALGLLLAHVGVLLLVEYGPSSIQRTGEFTIDGWLLGFTLLISLVTGLLFGLAPSILTSHTNLSEWLKSRAVGASNERHSGRLRNILVVGEIALALVLLITAVLLIRSFTRLREADVGFGTNNLLTMEVALPSLRYAEPLQQTSFFDALLSKVSNLPGVVSVGATSSLHLANTGIGYFFVVQGQPDEGPRNPIARLRIITPNYLNTLGVKLLQGRTFNEHDKVDAPKVMLINESMARRYFDYPNQNPIGKRIAYSKDRISCEIMGIVSDVKNSPADSQFPTEMYVPYEQRPSPSMSIIVRTTTPPGRLAEVIRQQVRQVDSAQPISNVRTMDEILIRLRAQPRFTMILLVVFAVIAFILAIVGIYSVMSYTVKQRTQEIGIRLALGCQTSDILKLVMRQGIVLIALGILLGLVGSFAATKVLGNLLFGVNALDPIIYGSMSFLLCAVAVAACLIPAKRATQVDPLIAIRDE